MRLISGQKSRFAGLDTIGFFRNGNFGISFDDRNKRIECGGVFRQTLADKEGTSRSQIKHASGTLTLFAFDAI